MWLHESYHLRRIILRSEYFIHIWWNLSSILKHREYIFLGYVRVNRRIWDICNILIWFKNELDLGYYHNPCGSYHFYIFFTCTIKKICDQIHSGYKILKINVDIKFYKILICFANHKTLRNKVDLMIRRARKQSAWTCSSMIFIFMYQRF